MDKSEVGDRYIVIAQWNGTEYVPVHLDAATRQLCVVAHSHCEIHSGRSFKADTVDTEMANGETVIIAFKTPNTTTWIHMFLVFSTKSAGHTDIVEGPSWDPSSGSQLPIYNRNRNSDISSVLLEDTAGSFAATDNVVLNPTNFTGGTIIHDFYTFVSKDTEGGNRDEIELLLKQDTTYGLKYTADLGSNAVHLRMDWYELADEPPTEE